MGPESGMMFSKESGRNLFFLYDMFHTEIELGEEADFEIRTTDESPGCKIGCARPHSLFSLV